MNELKQNSVKLANSNQDVQLIWNLSNNQKITQIYSKNQLMYKEYFKDGKNHRQDGPAVQRWNRNDKLIEEVWSKEITSDLEISENEVKQALNKLSKRKM